MILKFTKDYLTYFKEGQVIVVKDLSFFSKMIANEYAIEGTEEELNIYKESLVSKKQEEKILKEEEKAKKCKECEENEVFCEKCNKKKKTTKK